MSATLSQQIEAKIRAVVSKGGKPPFRLTLIAIAEYFEVSIQPVRTAVDILLADRWLLRGAGGKLVMNPDKKGAAFKALDTDEKPRPNLDEELERIIIQRSLRGEEVFLREEETAELLGVGRTILRAGLIRMNGRGLLEHVARRGWRVVGYSESRMLEYLDIRETLELMALKLARKNFDDRVLERLLEKNTPTAHGKTRIDNSLHGYWIEQSGNQFIADFFAQHGAYHSALFNYASLAGSFISDMANQHHAILQALLDKNYAVANRHLKEHIRAQRPNVAQLLEHLAANISDA